jgi:hypothetical protein
MSLNGGSPRAANPPHRGRVAGIPTGRDRAIAELAGMIGGEVLVIE